MLQSSHTTVVPKPPEEVFAFLADATNEQKWRSGVLDIAHESGEGVGARYRQGVKGPGGRRVAADFEFTAFEPPSRLAFTTVAGPVRPTGAFTLEPAEGGTRVTFSLQAEVTGLKKLVMGKAVAKTMEAEVRALDNVAAAMGA
jgi:uncharacterized protein YndB with AHSA1/START domain